MEKLIPKIFAKIKKTPRDITAYDDLFSLCRNIEGENFKLAHETNNDYVEALNLFNVAMGDCAEAAMDYAKTVEAVMGIDLKEWLRWLCP